MEDFLTELSSFLVFKHPVALLYLLLANHLFFEHMENYVLFAFTECFLCVKQSALYIIEA